MERHPNLRRENLAQGRNLPSWLEMWEEESTSSGAPEWEALELPLLLPVEEALELLPEEPSKEVEESAREELPWELA